METFRGDLGGFKSGSVFAEAQHQSLSSFLNMVFGDFRRSLFYVAQVRLDESLGPAAAAGVAFRWCRCGYPGGGTSLRERAAATDDDNLASEAAAAAADCRRRRRRRRSDSGAV